MSANKIIMARPGWGDEVFTLLSWFDIERVRSSKVLVVGAGALGNEVLKNLALFGVGEIFVVDFDTIEFSNLSRSVLFRGSDVESKRRKVDAAAERIRELNPDVKVYPLFGDVGPDVGLGIFREVDVVIGCLDSRLARFLINLHCFRAGKSWVDGGIENLEGYVRVFKPGVNCYECSLTNDEQENLHLRTGCPDIAKLNLSQGRVATTPVSASIIGAIQVQEALKIIHAGNSPANKWKTLEGKMYKYDGLHLSTNLYRMASHSDECASHQLWAPVIPVPGLGAETAIEDALALLQETLGTDSISIRLRNNKFIENIIPEKTEENIQVLLPESRISDYLMNNSKGINLTERVFQDFHEEIDRHFPFRSLSLHQAGIPFYDIIEVSTNTGLKYVLLEKDRGFYSIM